MNSISKIHTVDVRPDSVVPTFGYAVSGGAFGMLATAVATADDQGTTVWRPPSC